ncbi:MAG TPA: ligase-associated DNA damage response DEXH box helicase [Thermoanaerobaculia bacterium]|nr:ligase-associated DNA damage response DEXH box helicase [Thermoanaerobaculia bacterium]
MTGRPAALLDSWFEQRGWASFEFQRQVWEAYLAGESGLVHAATGTGKTYAVWLGPLLEWLAENPDGSAEQAAKRPVRPARRQTTPPLRVLWITPLRALAADTEGSLRAPLAGLGIPWSLERRTGDTSSALRSRQRGRLPTALVTTPESVSLFLSYPEARELFSTLHLVVVDEWHELLGGKRGVQTELALARLRRWCPGLRIWGLSATLGNVDEALRTLLGEGARPGRVVRGLDAKPVRIDSLLPDAVERFPWAGHLGLALLPRAVAAAEEGQSALIFTNTRSQTELWYQAILDARPDWAGEVALHHGSLDRKVRDWVEEALREGRLRCTVCTSSLDLGVDFAAVDRVLQVGSPKGVARLLQRAGRSGHRPGAESRVTCVPTHAFELVEVAAARRAIGDGRIEPRTPQSKPLDVLAQHLVTAAMGGGFEAGEMLAEVRTARAYHDLTAAEWEWVLDFVTRGGPALAAYPEYRRVAENDGRYGVADRGVAHRHRLSIGTITSDASVVVQYLSGGRLGTVEESFIARLRPGDRFVFAGKTLELESVRDLTAYVRKARGRSSTVPRWLGGRLPLSTHLAAAVREELEAARDGRFEGAEMEAVRPLLELQARWSILPAADELLIERLRSREGHHLFIYPFEGRLVHEGLAALFAWRLARRRPLTFTLAVNDYGFELLAADPAPLEEAVADGLLSPEGLVDDIPASLNAAEMAKRQFREIARIAGLLFEGLPGRRKPARHLQASSGLFYEVFTQYDPGNLLLLQAHREVLEQQLERSRLGRTLARLSDSRLTVVELARPSPLAFPLLIERLRATLSSEKLADRVRRMQAQLEKAAGPIERKGRRR